MRRWAGLAAALLLPGCAFWSERPLFEASEAATPFADGQHFIWREDGAAETQHIMYRRLGSDYEIVRVGEDDTPFIVTFVPVTETPESDYVIQASLRRDEESRVYAFMWATAQGHRIVAAPQALDAAPEAAALLDELCASRPNGECQLLSQEDLLALYLRAVYPTFVAGEAVPADFIDQLAVSGNE